MNYQLITTDEQLKSACDAAAQKSLIALDTEFVRTRTYYPQLGLIQMYDGDNVTLVDPLNIKDWSPFVALLTHPQVIKYLHACSEDLEVFLHEFNTIPTPMIDTQALAAFNQRPLSTGFATLVAEYLGVELDKSESRTDWLARPLTEKQCIYAAADVYYLLPIAEKIQQETQERGWLDAAKDECVMMGNRRRETLNPDDAYFEINNALQLNERQLGVLKLLAAWRLNYARERDMAVNFVVREESLWQVARYQPSSMGELEALGLSGPEIRFHGRTLLKLVAEGAALDVVTLPEKIVRIVDFPSYKRIFKDIKTLIQSVSAECGLNAELLASRRQINQLLKSYWQPSKGTSQSELLTGWRGELMGDRLRSFMAKETTAATAE